MTSVFVAYRIGDELKGCDPGAQILGVFTERKDAFKIFINSIIIELINTIRLLEYDTMDNDEREVAQIVLENTVEHIEQCFNHGCWNSCSECALLKQNKTIKSYFTLVDELWTLGHCVLDPNYSNDYQSLHIQETVLHKNTDELSLDSLTLN